MFSDISCEVDIQLYGLIQTFRSDIIGL